jgi:hypothetical protein
MRARRGRERVDEEVDGRAAADAHHRIVPRCICSAASAAAFFCAFWSILEG